MRTPAVLLWCSLAALLLVAGLPRAPYAAPDPEGPVVVVPLHGVIDEIAVALITRAVREARERKASHLVLRMDTPGGELDAASRIVGALEDLSAEVRTVAFVEHHATSAGALIATACDRLYMQPGANIGSAYVILQFAVPGVPENKVEEWLKSQQDQRLEKYLGELRAQFRACAQRTHRNEYLAEAMVDPRVEIYEVDVDGLQDFVDAAQLAELRKLHGDAGVRVVRLFSNRGEILNMTATEARDTRYCDGITPLLDDALDLLRVADRERVVLERSWSENLASWVGKATMVLLLVGLLSLFVELKAPGFGLPGILGILCLGLVLFGKYLVGLAEISEILLILCGLVLIAVELFVAPGTFVAGILGAVALLGGLLLSLQSVTLPGGSPAWVQDRWWQNAQNLALLFASSMVGMFVLGLLLPRIPILNRVILKVQRPAAPVVVQRDDLYRDFVPAIGAPGRTLTALRPAGRVEIEGRSLEASTEGEFVDPDRSVRVVRVQGNRIVVRKESEER